MDRMPDMNIQQHVPPPKMTVDEFFAWDGGGHRGKLELVEGVVRGMAPASSDHGIIQLNIGSMIRAHLRSKNSPCRVGTEVGVIPPLRQKTNARVPDISVTCAQPSASKVFVDPVLIVEVLSHSNEDETWDSIGALAGLASLKEILVVQSERIEALVFTRDATGAWPRDPVEVGAGGTILLASLGLELVMAEVFEGTQLAHGTREAT